MRIDVLNGVNLNLLGRRDQSIYGSQSIQDLETQIYAWARELDLQVRCRQTNNEGEYVGFLHQALGTALSTLAPGTSAVPLSIRYNTRGPELSVMARSVA